jgi:hypothetical protein
MQVDNLVPEIPVALKLEHLQHTGSFKARGAFNSLLAADVPKAGIVAASGGNHGAAVAYAAKSLGHECRIFIPETASPAKIEMIRRSGVEPVIIDGVYADALNAAAAFEADHGAISIHAYDDVATVCGQGTVLREWEAQGLEADTILVAVGGGRKRPVRCTPPLPQGHRSMSRSLALPPAPLAQAALAISVLVSPGNSKSSQFWFPIRQSSTRNARCGRICGWRLNRAVPRQLPR